MEEMFEFTVEETAKKDRLDKWVATQLEETSRSQVQRWIEEGHVTVNGTRAEAKVKVQTGDAIVVTVPPVEDIQVEPEPIPLDVYYEDEDVIVVNKPSGMVVHPAPGHASGTLVNALLHHCTDLSGINGMMRPGIVHRLDKDTSGLLMVAKNDVSHEALVRQLQNRAVHRAYKAIVHGNFTHETGTIDAPIGRDRADRQKMAVVPNGGREAITHFTVLETFAGYSLVECRLKTGRTHQIRVHMAYIQHPVAGDPKYGYKKTLSCDGQALHAETLGFVHPRTNESIHLTAPPPPIFAKLVDDLRSSS
ncbi:RluA family pseudouridine synthase [Bacillaceae bacterium SIJ1]|uniref:RluA family pseudouridine synthase n=1 Tax=Litoribacterium kuwaitense TaxID=1398745 RepID=UPI0013ED463F|nr:RluA family pseudouridine synthase [Litoribacterium kuwaitense]NGP44322.1 RluA family pseudouridine synthase [Litoribacterium kuwaitense]